MKQKLLALATLAVVNSAFGASALTNVTPTTAVQFNPSNTLNNSGQQNLRTQIQTMTNNLNNAAASLGVSQSNQIQWTGSAPIGGATNNIATDLGQLFYNIDNPYWVNNPNNVLTFNAGTWTTSGSAPVAATSGGCDLTCLITQANLTARNIGLQSTATINAAAQNIGGWVIQYNNAYSAPGAVTSGNVADATADYNLITTRVANTKSAVDAAKNFDFGAAFNTANGSNFFTNTSSATGAPSGVVNSGNGLINGVAGTPNLTAGTATASNGLGNNVTPTVGSALKTNGAGATAVATIGTGTSGANTSIAVGGKIYNSYTDYISGNVYKVSTVTLNGVTANFAQPEIVQSNLTFVSGANSYPAVLAGSYAIIYNAGSYQIYTGTFNVSGTTVTGTGLVPFGGSTNLQTAINLTGL